MKFKRAVAVTTLIFALNSSNLFYAKHDIRPPPVPVAGRMAQASAGQLPDISKIQLPQETPVQKDHTTEWAGGLAFLLSVGAFGMQLGRNWKVRKQEDISLRAWTTAFFVDSTWMAYGLLNDLYTVALSNGVALLPRAYGVYQLIKGQADDFKNSLARAANEILRAAEKMLVEGHLMESWVWVAVGDPLNTMAAAATMPAYLQFKKTVAEMKTEGISLGSQALYSLASAFWGINGFLFDKPAVAVSSLAGLFFYGYLARAKYRQLQAEGRPAGRELAQEAADTALFTKEKALKLVRWAGYRVGRKQAARQEPVARMQKQELDAPVAVEE